MELGPPSWRTSIVFSCRSLHEMHEIPQLKTYNVPKLYRYQRTPEKVASVKGKISISFTSSFRLVNICRAPEV